MHPKLESYFNIVSDNKKTRYTYSSAVILGLSALIIFIILYFYFYSNRGMSPGINELRLLFVPVVSILSMVLLRLGFMSIAKVFLIFASLFFFSYFTIWWGRATEEILLLNPIVIISFSALSFFIFDYKKERFYFIPSIVILFVLILFFDRIYGFSNLKTSLHIIAGEDYMPVKIGFVIAFGVINTIICYSVILNDKIQKDLDGKNFALEQSRSELLNQNLQLKHFQNEILNQNEELQSFTEELIAKNELIDAKNQDINLTYKYAKEFRLLLKSDIKSFYKYFDDFFVYEMTKGHMSSDFFWSKEVGSEVYFALIDMKKAKSSSTMLSMLCIKILNDILVERLSTKEILSALEEGLKNIHTNDEYKSQLFDIVICKYDLLEESLQMSSLGINVWYKSGTEINDLCTVNLNDVNSVVNQSVKLNKEDVIYIFTDGYYQQIGGDDKERLSLPRFRQIISEIAKYPLNLQEEKLNTFIKQWQLEMPQVDDITVVGIKIK